MQIRDFSKTGDVVEVPSLVAFQVESYRRFLQPECLPAERQPVGLEGLFREFFPVQNQDGSLAMEYLGYELGEPPLDQEECRRLGLTHAHSLRVRLRIVGTEAVEADVYLAELPVMIGTGEFIINGAERVIVSQIQRSPGVDFEERVEENGRRRHSFRFIPERGTWIEFSVSRRDLLQVRLGQSGLMPATWLLRAMICRTGGDAEVLALFYENEDVVLRTGGWSADMEKRYLAGDIVDGETGKLVAAAAEPLSQELTVRLLANGMKKVSLLKGVDDPSLIETVRNDQCKSREEAVERIFRRFRPGHPVTPERAQEFFAERFANPANYTLGRVGRFRINRKFNQEVPEDRLTLCAEDVLNAVRYLLRMRSRQGEPDDIDDLANRILRPIGRLLEDALRPGFVRLRRAIRQNLLPGEKGLPSPRAVANSRALAAAIEGFFARNELSQVADQTNPLAALNHLRRISALGVGGLNRKRAGFEVRDVHASHYGRICPIETPEGANIGLIASLGIFARVDKYGFITSPYRRLKGEGTGRIEFLRADSEKSLRLAPVVRSNGDRTMVARWGEEYRETPLADVDYADVSPMQTVGISAALIPFLEHDDANRALMGSNMQRQAVPLMHTEAPIVATGMERHIAANSGMVVRARKGGTVTGLDASHISIDGNIHPLAHFKRMSESTSLTQKPIVCEGQQVKAGEVIADGPATSAGKLSLGRNILVAFMMWDGYNFEDAIIISEDLVRADKYTSVHVEEFTCELRETRLGQEEFTRDIPNVSERILANLDGNGFIRIGAKVQPGDILVGKVAPKTKSELTPEDRLLRTIFGKAGIDVTNESLVLPPGSGGSVVDVAHFRRRAHLPEKERRESRREARKVEAEYNRRIADEFSLLVNELSALPRVAADGVVSSMVPNAGARDVLKIEQEFRFDLSILGESARAAARRSYMERSARIGRLKARRDHRVRQLRIGDQLPPVILEMVKVTVAVKRPLSAGDKVAGRHGNKGVIARIVPREDMPFLPDGTVVEMILNPLGVPSRMNVGQILETHLGWAGKVLGFRAVTPVFDGATEQEIRACLGEAGLPEDGKTFLFDGRTGDPFAQKVTVGYLYIMKLNHLVADKVHVRAVGPYSLITQQPLGGKARMGGQRLGEMEVWAMEAYGAAHILQEMLTVKSDDVEGRGRMFESIIKGRNLLESGRPVSLDVLIHEVRGLSLNMRFDRKAAPAPAVRAYGLDAPLSDTAAPVAERS